MHTDLTFIGILAALLVILIAAVSCSAGGSRQDGGSQPCETIVVLASPGSQITCPDPKRSIPPR